MSLTAHIARNTPTTTTTPNNPNILLYCVYHDDVSKKALDEYAHLSFIRPIKIPNTPYMESTVFTLLHALKHEWEHKSHVGILKYSFLEKTPVMPNFCGLVKENPHADVFTFVNGHEPPNNLSMIQYATLCHPMFSPIWYVLLKQLAYPPNAMYDNTIPAFYSNYWIAKTRLFEGYLNFIRDAMSLMNKNEELKQLLYNDAKYLPRLSKDTLKRVMDRPYYTYHCFICERLPCFYFHTNKANILQVGGKERINH